MTNMPIYEALAQAFSAEGVDTHFTLMGDGNMHWATAMKNISGMTTVHARHEHCACTMAMGYTSATGKVGVASVTCGPGFTQIMTALASASRGGVPMVVFAGETPLKAKWYGQFIDQQPLAAACGAHYITAHSPDRMYQYVREAFYVARHERKPVVIGVPYDLQKQAMPDIGAYKPSSTVLPQTAPMPPNPEQLAYVVDRLAQAKAPIILAGRGVIWSGARTEVEALAEASGALLSTTLLGRGMYDHNPFSVGVCGGFARAIAREAFAQSDLVLAIGASLTYHTMDGGRIIPEITEVIQIDPHPIGLRDGLEAADIYVKADAKLTATALLTALEKRGPTAASIRSAELARRIREEPADNARYDIAPGTLDPRAVFAELETVIPRDYDMVSGSGHQSYFHTVMRGGEPTRYHAMRDFGAIGNAISYAVGIAAVRKTGKVVLFEGDGSLLMHVQEFETLRRQGIKMLIVCSNDGAYGAEIHKLREDGIDDTGAIFGRPDFAEIARGFGLRGENVTTLGRFRDLLEEFERGDTTMVWNVHMSDLVVNPRMRQNVKAGHGAR
ncbi:thiamine pyrophosphate-binding protein [Devosia ginsengisoli]|uniref:Thiamine pyrophosphate-binding protein n=1 Tax=Devosia ginsengisoli TaxID=400770 RepID=A0A5B8LSM9_9HYPH|nr:thiamine pyrophosphate-binding protein [Devosia ginsengisoli]QDZ10250.1 thiamine pyrophosphate-binding protein [Devosia ginsengisoli]